MPHNEERLSEESTRDELVRESERLEQTLGGLDAASPDRASVKQELERILRLIDRIDVAVEIERQRDA